MNDPKNSRKNACTIEGCVWMGVWIGVNMKTHFKVKHRATEEQYKEAKELRKEHCKALKAAKGEPEETHRIRTTVPVGFQFPKNATEEKKEVNDRKAVIRELLAEEVEVDRLEDDDSDLIDVAVDRYEEQLAPWFHYGTSRPKMSQKMSQKHPANYIRRALSDVSMREFLVRPTMAAKKYIEKKTSTETAEESRVTMRHAVAHLRHFRKFLTYVGQNVEQKKLRELLTNAGYVVSKTNLHQVDKELEAVISKTSEATAMEDVDRLNAKKIQLPSLKTILEYPASSRAMEAADIFKAKDTDVIATQSLHTMTRNYLIITILLRHAHHGGVVANFTLDEFYDETVKDCDQTIIRYSSH